jgi:hypothetical protein
MHSTDLDPHSDFLPLVALGVARKVGGAIKNLKGRNGADAPIAGNGNNRLLYFGGGAVLLFIVVLIVLSK